MHKFSVKLKNDIITFKMKMLISQCNMHLHSEIFTDYKLNSRSRVHMIEAADKSVAHVIFIFIVMCM